MIFFFILPLIIMVLLHFCNTRSRKDRISREEFWKKERDSRFVPRKDLSELEYLTIDYRVLPLRFWQPGANGPVVLDDTGKPGTSDTIGKPESTGTIVNTKTQGNAAPGTLEKPATFSSDDASLSMTMETVEAMLGVSPAATSKNAATLQPAPAIDEIPFVSPLDYQKPHMAPLSEELSEAEYELCAMAQKKILNLTGISNTELRLTYGTANLDPLAACDQNYTALIRLLQKWGNLLISSDCKDDAICVLSYAVSIGSDIAGTYAQLSRLYAECGEYKKIEELRTRAEQLTTLMKPSILRDLDTLLAASSQILP